MEKAVEKLKEIIESKGPDYLTDEPYLAYKELIDSGSADKKTAGALLLFLVSDLLKNAPVEDAVALSKLIQRECCLNKRMADKLAKIVGSLYSKDNKIEWKNKDKAGLQQFVKEKLLLEWRGESTWEGDGGSDFCHYTAKIVLSPKKGFEADDKLKQAFEKNPFTSKEKIREHYTKKLVSYLDNEFEEYCTCDDYYEPVVEDFEAEYYTKKWCDENGFKLVSFEGDGCDDGFEPYFRKRY